MASRFVGERPKKLPRRACLEYSLLGTCRKGDGCPYGHDSDCVVQRYGQTEGAGLDRFSSRHIIVTDLHVSIIILFRVVRVAHT